jgi:hypothetical protein
MPMGGVVTNHGLCHPTLKAPTVLQSTVSMNPLALHLHGTHLKLGFAALLAIGSHDWYWLEAWR